MKKLWFYMLSVGFLLFIAQTNVFACSCIGETPGVTLETRVKEAKDSYDAVFTGKVLKVIKDSKNYGVIVKLRLLKSFKGKLSREITIHTGSGGADCGYKFNTGTTYLVYASSSAAKNILSTSICSRTKRATAASEELRLLEKKNLKSNESDN